MISASCLPCMQLANMLALTKGWRHLPQMPTESESGSSFALPCQTHPVSHESHKLCNVQNISMHRV